MDRISYYISDQCLVRKKNLVAIGLEKVSCNDLNSIAKIYILKKNLDH
jgi:hypothetical protein